MVYEIHEILRLEIRKDRNNNRPVRYCCKIDCTPVRGIPAHEGDLVPLVYACFPEQDMQFKDLFGDLFIGISFFTIVRQSFNFPVLPDALFDIPDQTFFYHIFRF